MKAVSFSFAFVLLFSAAALAGSLGKYADEPAAPMIQQKGVTPDEINERLTAKMEQAIRILKTMPEEERRSWIVKYRQKLNEARKNNNHLEAAYYKGILAGVAGDE